eukprot:gene34750-44942_t
MGGSSSTLVITLDHSEENVLPGSVLTGKVYMDVVVEKLDAESLMIRLVGMEKVQVRFTTGHGRTWAFDQSIFLDVNVPLTISSNGVESSMRCDIDGNDGGFAEIKYNIEARIHRRGWIKWDVFTSKEINVVSFKDLGTVPKIQGYVQPHAEKVHLCCCINRGSIAMGMSTPSTSLAVQDSFAANYVIENESSAIVKAVEIKIMERVNWTARTLSSNIPPHVRNRESAEAIFSLRINAADMNGGISALSKEEKAMLDETAVLKRLKDALDSKANVLSGKIDGKYSTYAGTIVQIRHTLEVTVCTTFGTSNPQVTIPLILYHSPIGDNSPFPTVPPPSDNKDQKHTSLPSNWNAQLYSSVSLPLPIRIEPVAVPNELDAPSIDAGPQTIPPLAPQQHSSGIDRLLQLIEYSFDASSAFTSWQRENQRINDIAAVDALTPIDFGKLFGSIRGMLDQVTIAERLAEARSSVTSLHIARAAAASFDLVRTDVVARLAIKVVDKENKNVVQAWLTPFQFILVEKYFRD